MLRKSPGFTAIALVTLAIGIGANTIMFSITDLLLLRPMKVREPEQLVCCDTPSLLGGIPYSAYVTIRDNNPIFRDLMAQDGGTRPVTLVHQDVTRQVRATFVSASYFSLLGVAPARGRGFLPQEELRGASPVVVLTHRVWQWQGADPEIVGQYISLNGVRCQVVGIAPEGFTGVTMTGPDVWLPVGNYLSVARLSRGETSSRRGSMDWDYPRDLKLVGRLQPGLSMSAAQAQIQLLVPRLKEEYPKHWSGDAPLHLHRPPRLSLEGDPEEERVGQAIINLVLMGVSATILVIACLNLANMLIVQGAGRQREIAVRLALGSGRLRIVRQLLIESLLLALLGGAFGLFLAFWGTQILNAWIPMARFPETRDLRTGLNVRVVAATLGFSLMATLLFGLRPALSLSRRDLAGAMKESRVALLGPVRGRRGGLSVLGQTALAVVLVMSAALFTRSALRLARPNPRFQLDDKLVVQLDPLSAGYDPIRSAQVCEALADHLESLPGVESVGMSRFFSFGGSGGLSIHECTPGEGPDASRRQLAQSGAVCDVGKHYFAALGIPLLQGRLFDRLDSAPGAEKVMIIDESLARKLRPDGNALGCFVQYGIVDEYSEPYRVVGIVANVRDTEVTALRAQAYKPAKPDLLCPYIYLHVADGRAAAALVPQISAEIHKVDSRVPVLSAATLAQRRRNDDLLWGMGFCARLARAAGAAALFLAALGIYATKGYMVASRTSEIGIRKALGATHQSIIGMVLCEGLILTVAGLMVGLLLGLGVARIAASRLYVSPLDPVSIAVTVALLGAASLLASYIPARRAARIDPMVALRYE
jgi:predicted permease